MSNFIKALNGNNPHTPPIWMMRQAGRYHSHYRKIKNQYSFEEICKTPKLAAEVALAPIQAFDFDAGILFSDILYIVEGLGYNVTFNPGPIITTNNDKTKKDISFLSFQANAIIETKKLLGSVPLIGFVGGIATIFKFIKADSNLHERHSYINNFCYDIIDLYIQNIKMQIDAGVNTIAILDSRTVPNTHEYWSFTQKNIIDVINKYCDIPIIYYSDCQQHETLEGLACVGLNSKNDPVHSIQRNFGLHAVQGTFDEQLFTLPHIECAKKIEEYFQYIFDNTTPTERTMWVNSPGHGVPKNALEENIKYFVTKGKEAFKIP
ncbi:MAG: uroporphyrinogen decarboxylase [Candidatus Deianiraeaceae bacterium]